MDVRVGQLVTSGTTNPIDMRVTDIADGHKKVDHIIKVVSGSWRFGRNSIPAGAHVYTTADGNNIAVLSCYPGELFAQATSNADTLVIT